LHLLPAKMTEKNEIVNNPQITGDWRTTTNMNIVNNLLEKVAELLDGDVKHYICCDRTTQHEKIVIEYNHSSNT